MGAIPIAPIFRHIPLVSCVVNTYWNVDMAHAPFFYMIFVGLNILYIIYPAFELINEIFVNLLFMLYEKTIHNNLSNISNMKV